MDRVAKKLLTCIPEPDGHALEAMVATVRSGATIEERVSNDGRRFAAVSAEVPKTW